MNHRKGKKKTATKHHNSVVPSCVQQISRHQQQQEVSQLSSCVIISLRSPSLTRYLIRPHSGLAIAACQTRLSLLRTTTRSSKTKSPKTTKTKCNCRLKNHAVPLSDDCQSSDLVYKSTVHSMNKKMTYIARM